MEKNEFENINIDDESAPEQSFSETPVSPTQEEMISAGSAGTSYDWSKAPEGIKAPPRIDLNGQTLTILKADIILPPSDREWQTSRSGTTKYKYCTFALFYDKENQQEFYSGVRVFQRMENGVAKYSHPTIMRDRKNQASQLLGSYADFKKVDINQVSLREFMGFLNGKPKVEIKTAEVKNPQNNEIIKKNMVAKFVN